MSISRPRLVPAVVATGLLLVTPGTAAAQTEQPPAEPDTGRTLLAWEVPDAHPVVTRALDELEERLDDVHPDDPLEVVDLPGPTTIIGLDARIAPAPLAEVTPMRISGTGIRILSHLDGRGPGLSDHEIDLEIAMHLARSERTGNLDAELTERIEAARQRRADRDRIVHALDDPNLTEEGRARLTSELVALTATDQIDALRLQSTTMKRNESVETMNQLVKQVQDSLGRIVGNMR